MKVTSLAVFAASAFAVALPVNQDFDDSNGPAPGQVTIEKTGYSGNGCPQGSVSTLLSPDKSVVTFGFDSFQAVLGNGASPNDKQKNCQLHLGLHYPQGFQVSVMSATYHGYVRLDPGVNANFISTYYFSQNAGRSGNFRTVLGGPEYVNGKTYTKQDQLTTSSLVWSPCGADGILNVNSRIALTAPPNNRGASGEVSNDDATLKFENKLYLQWRRC